LEKQNASFSRQKDPKNTKKILIQQRKLFLNAQETFKKLQTEYLTKLANISSQEEKIKEL